MRRVVSRHATPSLRAAEADALLLCLATSSAISELPNGTPDKLLYAGDVFTNPYDERAIACGLSTDSLPPAPPTTPPSPAQPPGLCGNACTWAFDGYCDDGGTGALYDWCEWGSDCSDCGLRLLEPPLLPQPALPPSPPG